MIVCVAHNIISPLGMTSAENYAAVKAGSSMLKPYEELWGLPDPFVASLMDREQVEHAFSEITDNQQYTMYVNYLSLQKYSGFQQHTHPYMKETQHL